ncbi:hypothetical protein [Ktedonospora formicarum]|uniref:Uncharacterized protein n=1 Tax=Ktedonospora formicarum TaxID=2778364 RepID=A0A8J3MQU0_9CHLR|nr:hypothetical protein [Ktedonospora formicarum]GHO43121.1 hypothetical protein KSX_12840 [Ktedonospora formicarum]
MTESANWREVLGRIIQDTHQRQRIANALDINPVTLTRWANNTSTPRTQNLRQLLQALPEHSAAFMESLPDEVSKPFQDPEMMSVEVDTITISPLFYSRLVNAHCNLPSILRFSSLCDMILQQIIKHLDPHRVGLELTVVKCMPPSIGERCVAREKLPVGAPHPGIMNWSTALPFSV